MLRTLLQIVLKDLRIFAADRRALILSFFVPIAIASFMGTLSENMGIVEKPKPIPLLFVDNDHSDTSAKLRTNLQKSKALAFHETTDADARNSVKSGTYGVAAVVPKGFGDMASRGGKPELEIVVDPSQSLQAQAVRGILTQATAGAILGGDTGEIELPFQLKQTTQTSGGNQQWSGIAHAFAGMGVQGLLFWSIELAMGLMRERNKGIWRRLRSSPAPMSLHVFGRAISSTIRAMLIVAAVFGFGSIFFHVKVSGSWLGFGLVWVCASIMAATFGLFVAALGKSEQQSRGLAVLVVLFMTMLGGAWFPSFLMPPWVQTVSNFIPAKHAVDAFDAMTWRGQSFNVAVPSCAALLGFAAVFLLIALRRFTGEADST